MARGVVAERVQRATAPLAKPRGQVWFNGALMVAFAAFMPYAYLHPRLGGSVAFVTQLSLWALVATHLGAWISALVNVRAERIDNRTEANAHFARIEQAEQRILDGQARILDALIEPPT